MKLWALLRRYYLRVMIVGFVIGVPLVLWTFWWEPDSLQVQSVNGTLKNPWATHLEKIQNWTERVQQAAKSSKIFSLFDRYWKEQNNLDQVFLQKLGGEKK